MLSVPRGTARCMAPDHRGSMAKGRVLCHLLRVCDIKQGQHVSDVAVKVVFDDQAFIGENNEAIVPFGFSERFVLYFYLNLAHSCTNAHTRKYTHSTITHPLHEPYTGPSDERLNVGI